MSISRVTIVVCVAALVGAAPAWAKVKAGFLGDGIWATAADCAKLKAIAAGGPRNIETDGEMLTADGYEGWEHSCAFVSVGERRKGQIWSVRSKCAEGLHAWVMNETFTKQPDGSFKVVSGKDTLVYQRCDVPPRKR